jgi:hypothetical protein
MRDAAFCHFGLLKCPGRFDQILSVLPERRRAALAGVLEEARRLSPAELKQRLVRQRMAELIQQRQEAARKLGLRLGPAPPKLRRWICDFALSRATGPA